MADVTDSAEKPSIRRPVRTKEEDIDRREQALDDALKGSFPASDPPAVLAPHHPRK